MYVSVLVVFDSTMEDFFKSLCPELANSEHKVYTHSIQAPFNSKIGWLFQTHKHTDLPHLTKVLQGILCCLNPNALPLPWIFSLS